MRDFPQIKYNPASQAKANQIKREVEREVEDKNSKIPVFMFQGYGFRPYYRAMTGSLNMEGPLCPRLDVKAEMCLSILAGESNETKISCDVCGYSGILPQPLSKNCFTLLYQ